MTGDDDASHPVSQGQRIGDYQIEGQLGDDGTAIVYLATHVVLPRQAHLKVPSDGSRAAAVQVLREACILEAVSQPGYPGHPGIPRVYECGVLEDRRPWSALERIAGVSLDQMIGGGSLALPELVVVLREIADILRHAHDRGIVHGSLNAVTIVRTPRRRSGYALADWGQARALDANTNVAVDPRDDVYALGAIAFRALSGVPIAPGRMAATFCPSAPAELVAMIDQMLAEPVARPDIGDVLDRATWLCETLQAASVRERPRWTPPQSMVSEGLSSRDPEDDSGGFAVRIGRPRTS